jgi:NADP-reducing hydrogenase subunit HndB
MDHKITGPADLVALRQKARARIDLRGGAKDLRITVHMGTCGIAAGARDVLSALMQELSAAPAASVTLQQAGCAGLCDREPMMTLTDKEGDVFRYGSLDQAKVRRIVAEHVLGGKPVEEYLIKL